MNKVVRWTFWSDDFYPEIDGSSSEEEDREYDLVVIQALRDKHYKISGFAHQNDPFCVPVFQDGKRYCCSFRSWGAIMARALGNDDRLGYVQWAWDAPEEEKHPVPSDWNDPPEMLAAQRKRWEWHLEHQEDQV